MTAAALCRVNAILTGAWLAAVLPTVLWWRESILWVAVMSVWANVASHYTAWQAARAELAAQAAKPTS